MYCLKIFLIRINQALEEVNLVKTSEKDLFERLKRKPMEKVSLGVW